jgi:hypothetical protein
MYSQKYIFQIALKCERKTKNYFFFKLKKKNRVGPVFQARAGTITNFFYVALYGYVVMLSVAETIS